MKRSSHRGTPEDIDLKDTWFAPDPEEDPRETPSHDPIVAPENNNKIITTSQSKPHVQEIPAREGAFAVHELPCFQGSLKHIKCK